MIIHIGQALDVGVECDSPTSCKSHRYLATSG